ncbi:hypothetical protein [Leptospira noguchii]|uniref:hypothetical protein n=1 Tax=Leptospira noguchii TaxID=28182 RepID=UPI0012BCC56C|nr:hypothetical protein [Leptospira noguchii]
MDRSRKLSVSLLGSLEETQRLASRVARGNSASHSQWVVRGNSASHSQWVARGNSASHSQWVVRGNSASHSQWVVRGNSASHSQWVVRQVTKVKIIIRKMFKFIFPIKAERK